MIIIIIAILTIVVIKQSKAKSKNNLLSFSDVSKMIASKGGASGVSYRRK